MYDPVLQKRTVSEVLQLNFSDYYLPSIQREFVWDPADVKDMLDSLLRGYPTGIITIFKTDLDFPRAPLIDSEPHHPNNKGEKMYVLDGQQRLTSLLLIRDGWKIKRDKMPIELKSPILLNPDTKKLQVKGKKSAGADFSELLGMCTFDRERNEKYQEILKYLYTDFLNRPIAFYEVEVKKEGRNPEEVYTDMAEIFTRINKAGVRLGNLEMFLSFFASVSIGKDQIVRLHKELNDEYQMDLEPLIRSVFSNMGLKQDRISKIASFKRALKKIKDDYNELTIQEVIKNSRLSILVTMSLLRHELGISSNLILPSETALVPLFLFNYVTKKGDLGQIAEKDRKNMIRWFVTASFNAIYSSHTDSRLESDLALVKKSGENGTYPVESLLASMKEKIKVNEITEADFRNINTNILRGSAGKRYLFILYLLLSRNGATDWVGNPLMDKKFKDLARHHIFPREKLSDDYNEIEVNHLGNLTFIDAAKNEELQDELPEEYLEEYSSDVLRKHFIPDNKSFWKFDNYLAFIDKRIELIWSSVKEFTRSLG